MRGKLTGMVVVEGLDGLCINILQNNPLQTSLQGFESIVAALVAFWLVYSVIQTSNDLFEYSHLF